MDGTTPNIGGQLSFNLFAVSIGVPHGSVFGPTFFSLFGNDLPKAVT